MIIKHTFIVVFEISCKHNLHAGPLWPSLIQIWHLLSAVRLLWDSYHCNT